MTDPRIGDELIAAVRRLPFRSGVIFRHYELGNADRYRLFRNVARTCRQRGHILLLADGEREALRWHADGFHQRSAKKAALIHSAPVHNPQELALAARQRTDLVLISPVFATASHPDRRPLSRQAFNQLAVQAHPICVIALGGVTRRKAAGLNPHIVYGWAAIDAFRKKAD